MDPARMCSLQQITEAFFEVGGQFRRNVWERISPRRRTISATPSR
jgi:hypothetical protein